MFNSFVVRSFWKHQSREDAVSILTLSNLWLKEDGGGFGTWWHLNQGNNGKQMQEWFYRACGHVYDNFGYSLLWQHWPFFSPFSFSFYILSSSGVQFWDWFRQSVFPRGSSVTCCPAQLCCMSMFTGPCTNRSFVLNVWTVFFFTPQSSTGRG